MVFLQNKMRPVLQMNKRKLKQQKSSYQMGPMSNPQAAQAAQATQQTPPPLVSVQKKEGGLPWPISHKP